ncbi:hypothetical protein D0864_08454 [Hortaea werneckii]|uniref:Cation efflux protein cytoplasmic domain-containing protein n=1 Tax=Hortaea werneckii TaxID=91943 RepID=A0A3M7EWR0_HORWE|nr:hypothetical protein D0864_08454 [Hortaea werneckii]
MSTWSRFRDRKARKAHYFHTAQDEHIDRLVRVANDPAASRLLDDKQDSSAFHVKAAVALSIYGTILVAGLQIYAAVTTLSLSLFVTMAESCCAERLSNAGNICFAFALMAVSLVLVVESIRALASPTHELGNFHVAAIVAAASQLEMLWKDNRNYCFEYGFAIFASAAGAKLQWWVDPAGAMVIAIVIMVTWIGTVRSEFLELCGVGAAPSVVQEIIFITIRHSPLILKVDTAHAYHWGEDLFVEVDIVMDPKRSLREVHDISQELQDKLETIEGVARAFVHVVYETAHAPEHRKTR